VSPVGNMRGQFDVQQVGFTLVVVSFVDATTNYVTIATLNFSATPVQTSEVTIATSTTHNGRPSVAVSRIDGSAVAFGYAASNGTYITRVNQLGLWTSEVACDPTATAGLVVTDTGGIVHCVTNSTTPTGQHQMTDRQQVAAVWGPPQNILNNDRSPNSDFDFVTDTRGGSYTGIVGVVAGYGAANVATFVTYDKTQNLWQSRGHVSTQYLSSPRLAVVINSTGSPGLLVAALAHASPDAWNLYASLDGGSTWKSGFNVGVSPLQTLRFNPTSWNIRPRYTSARLTYEFVGGAQRLGWTIGGTTLGHAIPATTAKAAAVFPATATGSASSVTVMTSLHGQALKYRVGLQSVDGSGIPTGTWVVEQRSLLGTLTGGSFADVLPTSGRTTVTLGSPASLTAGTTYALVMEPAPTGLLDPTVSSTQYASLVGTSVSAGSAQSTSVRSFNGSAWQTTTDEVPIMTVTQASPLAVDPIHVCHTGLLEARGC
jgi:hypothetical protein